MSATSIKSAIEETDVEKLRRLNIAFQSVKKSVGPNPKLYYRTNEYRALQNHARKMKK